MAFDINKFANGEQAVMVRGMQEWSKFQELMQKYALTWKNGVTPKEDTYTVEGDYFMSTGRRRFCTVHANYYIMQNGFIRKKLHHYVVDNNIEMVRITQAYSILEIDDDGFEKEVY